MNHYVNFVNWIIWFSEKIELKRTIICESDITTALMNSYQCIEESEAGSVCGVCVCVCV